jgi:CheY-like chemotaxis protein
MNRLAEELWGVYVLVIDDDQLARHFLRSVLEFSGAIVTAVGTRDALRVAPIADVIVCDLASAEAAGGEFISQFQHLHVRLGRAVPAIALIPARVPSARMRAAGFRMYLMKPIDGDELRAALLEGLPKSGDRHSSNNRHARSSAASHRPFPAFLAGHADGDPPDERANSPQARGFSPPLLRWLQVRRGTLGP